MLKKGTLFWQIPSLLWLNKISLLLILRNIQRCRTYYMFWNRSYQYSFILKICIPLKTSRLSIKILYTLKNETHGCPSKSLNINSSSSVTKFVKVFLKGSLLCCLEIWTSILCQNCGLSKTTSCTILLPWLAFRTGFTLGPVHNTIDTVLSRYLNQCIASTIILM